MGDVKTADAGVRVVDEDKNLVRILFFIIGLMTGVTMMLWINRHPRTATDAKFFYNRCPRYADGTSSCGMNADTPGQP
jgi:hypothetical protein